VITLFSSSFISNQNKFQTNKRNIPQRKNNIKKQEKEAVGLCEWSSLEIYLLLFKNKRFQTEPTLNKIEI